MAYLTTSRGGKTSHIINRLRKRRGGRPGKEAASIRADRVRNMHRRELPLTALRSFEAVGHAMSFSRAAEVLGVTHGAVSRQIAALESLLGVRLFDRSGRLRFTREGEILFRRIAPAFDTLSEAVMEISRRDDRTVLRLNAPPTFTMKWLIPRLSTFQRRHPEIEVRLSTGIDLPKSDDANYQDVIIRRLSRIDTYPQSKPFLSSALLPVCAPELLQRRSIRTPNDLEALPLIEIATSMVRWADWMERAGGQALGKAKIIALEQMFFGMQAALDGLGVALLPSALVLDDIAAERLAVAWITDTIQERDYFYAVSPAAKGVRAVTKFTEWLAKEGADANRLGRSVIHGPSEAEDQGSSV